MPSFGLSIVGDIVALSGSFTAWGLKIFAEPCCFMLLLWLVQIVTPIISV
ncbi:hypothetical protein DSUL_100228 [Desulfovibrionales bacterium]